MSSRSEARVQMSMTGRVVGALLARHDLAVRELVADLLHHDAGRALDGADGERREQERHGATDQQTDEHLGIGHVDRDGAEDAARRVLQRLDRLGRQDLGARDLDEAGEQRHRGDDRGADGEALGDGLGGVAHRVEADHDPLGLAVELARHLGDAGGVVGHRAERVLGHDDAGGGEHAHAGEGDEVQRELRVAAAEPDGGAEGDGDGDDRPHRRLEARRRAGQHRGGGAGLGGVGDLAAPAPSRST